MIEEIVANIYKIEIPLPENPLKSLNSYVVKASGRNLIIDTGMNQEECLNAMKSGLRDLGIDMRKTDFFITHIHPDHIGLVSKLVADTSRIYFNQPEADQIKSGTFLDDFANFARLNGFPEDELPGLISRDIGLKEPMSFHILKEGDKIAISEYIFNCVETPGHTTGHMCLYEPNKRILVAGDHILNDITPTIQLWSDEGDALKEYLKSLDKIYQLDIELVLPGHRDIFGNYKERIEELRHHHQLRLDGIISILEKGKENAFQIASGVSWDVVYESWDEFPVLQKWFATGEVIAHLKYLEEKRIARKELWDNEILYSLNLDPPI